MTALTAPPINTLSLTQFREATRNYLDNEVEVEIVDVTTGVIRGGDGVFTVRVTNSTAERGVRLHDVTVHLELRAGGEIRLQPPTSPANLEARDGGSRSDRELSPNEQVNEMFVFFPQAPVSPQDDVLDPGESVDFEGRYHAQTAGTTAIKAHVHASIHPEDLFPRSNGDSTRVQVTINNAS